MTFPSRYQQLRNVGLRNLSEIYHNLTPAQLYEHAIQDEDINISQDGALVTRTYNHTGRAPNDRFIVREPETQHEIDWGDINKPFDADAFGWLYQKMEDFFYGKPVYVQDCFAGTHPDHRIGVRIVTEKAWHSLFSRNMFVSPEPQDLETFEPDYTVIHAPSLQADPQKDKTHSEAFVLIHLSKRLVLIGGTHYGGEIKKSIFSIMNYLLPKKGILPMHCSANEGDAGDVALFFGLSGTGKTTLSADARRHLIGDDEHGWGDDGVFNFEGGCYAKTINLSAEGEPEIYGATKQFGTILENVILDHDRNPDFTDSRYTLNTRCSYPISAIPNHKPDGRGGQPRNIIFLTADAFGVLPPVSKLTPEQAMTYFLNGYTAKVAGTETGIDEPQATFSACFGAPFMPLNPRVYAELLRQKAHDAGATIWLVNTGWTGGAYGTGHRIELAYTRAIVDAILDGTLAQATTREDTIFGLMVPTTCPNVPDAVLDPRQTWNDKEAYDREAQALADRFQDNARKYLEPVPTGD
jgi:phosphoenolpyruvate carboxykinase (ATP)